MPRNLLSTDARCLVIILRVQWNMVDFTSRGPSALADILFIVSGYLWYTHYSSESLL